MRYPAAELVPSPNFTPGRAAALSHVVLHTCEGSTLAGCVATLSDPYAHAPVSAHYVVGPGGRVLSLVADEDTAWHAGGAGYNAQSIGIEIVGFADDPATWTAANLDALGDLVGWLSGTYGIPLVYRETSDQAPIPRGFVAHGAIDPTRRMDPGTWFPWATVAARAQGAPPAPPSGTGLVVLGVLGVAAALLAWGVLR